MTDAAPPETVPETVLDATGAQARLARVYADALHRAALASGEADAIAEELDAVVSGALTGHPAVGAFFASAAVHKSAKLPVLAAAFNATTSATFQKFVGVLNQNRRLDLLPAVASAYRALRDAAAGRVRVAVTAAAPLSPDQAAKLETTLSATLKGTPVVRVTVDPDILGGLIVRVGDTVYDTSVRTRLDTLRTHLMASGTHG